MNKKQKSELMDSAASTIDELEKKRGGFSREEAILYGSMLGALDHERIDAIERELSQMKISPNPEPGNRIAQPEITAAAPQPLLDTSAVPGIGFLSGIKDELSDAEKYLNWYHQTKNTKYLEISKQEMEHAEILFTEARGHGVPDAELRPLVRLHNVLLAKF
ncbi:MAG: hypothetical protein FWH02_05105 [Oscillospiraceae bacterium]|nr:hypothetical protein [Oscillospiraceae bacterium]